MELHVRVVDARNLLDVQRFGSQDPFCTLKLSGRKQGTSVDNNGGRSPSWNEKFVFQVSDPERDYLVVKVKNKGCKDSDLIGECRIPMSMYLHGQIVDQWFTLSNELSPAGEIHLRFQLVRDGPPPQAYAYPPPQGYPLPQGYPPQPGYPPPPPPQGYSPQYGYPPQPGYPPSPGYPPQQYAYAVQPAVVVEERRHYDDYDRYNRGGGRYEERGNGMSTGQMALGVGAGVVGGVLLADAVEDVFDDE